MKTPLIMLLLFFVNACTPSVATKTPCLFSDRNEYIPLVDNYDFVIQRTKKNQREAISLNCIADRAVASQVQHTSNRIASLEAQVRALEKANTTLKMMIVQEDTTHNLTQPYYGKR